MSAQSSADLFKLFDKLVSKPYHINRFFVKIAGSITDGYLLTQLTYLYQRADYQPFSPRDQYLREKYDLGDKELRGARSRLKAKGLITTELKGLPAKLHYTVNTDRIMELALTLPAFQTLISPASEEQPSLPKRDKLSCTKGTNFGAGKGQTINNNTNNIFNNNLKKEIVPLPTVACAGKGELDNGFEEFYRLYPKKIAKPKAKQAFAKAIKLVPLEQILKAVQNQTLEREQKARVGAFVPEWPYPTTWLNQGRWDDHTQPNEQIERMAPKGKTRQQERNDAFKVSQSLMEMINSRIPQLA